MDWLYRGLSILIILLGVRFALKKKSKMNVYDMTIKSPYNFTFLGSFHLLFSGCILVLVYFFEDIVTSQLEGIIISVIFFLLGLFMILYNEGCYTEIKEDEIVVSKFFFKTHYDVNNTKVEVRNFYNTLINEKGQKSHVSILYPNGEKVLEKITASNPNITLIIPEDVRMEIRVLYFGFGLLIPTVIATGLSIYGFIDAVNFVGDIFFYFMLTFTFLFISCTFWTLTSYKNFEVKIENDMLCRRTFLNVKKQYQLSSISYLNTKNGMKIYYKNQFIFYLNDYLNTNVYILKTNIKQKNTTE